MSESTSSSSDIQRAREAIFAVRGNLPNATIPNAATLRRMLEIEQAAADAEVEADEQPKEA